MTAYLVRLLLRFLWECLEKYQATPSDQQSFLDFVSMWLLFVLVAVVVSVYIACKYGGSDDQIVRNCVVGPGARVIQTGHGRQVIENSRINTSVTQSVSRGYTGGRVSQVISGCTVDAPIKQKVTGRASGRNISQEVVGRHVTRDIVQIDGDSGL